MDYKQIDKDIKDLRKYPEYIVEYARLEFNESMLARLKHLGMSVEELADKSGVSTDCLLGYNDISLDQMAAAAAALGSKLVIDLD